MEQVSNTADALNLLAKDSCWTVRKAVVQNPNVSQALLLSMVNDEAWPVREEVALRLGEGAVR